MSNFNVSELDEKTLLLIRCCDAQLDDKDRDDLKVSGFDFAVLLPLVIQILTQLMGNCFKNATPEEVAKELAKGNSSSKVRHAAFRAVGQATDGRISSRKQLKISTGIGNACQQATAAQRLEFVTGVKEATDWTQG